MTGPAFTLLATDGAARRGRLDTAHGPVETPAFMPVGTAATVKAMPPDLLAATGAAMVLANTYHLMLRPGADRVARLGGLHRFMAWPGPILTDSGGYQVMSLGELARVRWAARCRDAFVERPGYGLFGIVQGGVYADLRRESVEVLGGLGFDGYAVGGLAVGEGQATMFQVLEATTPLLPADRPRYLMGVGKPDDLVGAVGRGIDLFDCVLPTRSGRTGQAFTRRGAINIENARHADDPRPLDEECRCPGCRSVSRAYLHHLTKAREILGAILLTAHNLTYYQDLMAGLRAAIAAGRYQAFADDVAATAAAGDVAALP